MSGSREGTRIGLVALIALVGFVAVWLNRIGNGASPEPASTPVGRLAARLDGFGADVAYLPDDSMLGFVKVPAGPFIMGSDPTLDRMAYENERWSPTSRQGEVELPDYYIGRLEVTNAQYLAFLQATGGYTPELADNPRLPVVNVSWPDALAYCRWLESFLVGAPATPAELRSLLNQGWRISLPSEAEWEKAARGPQGRTFPWGMAVRPGVANYSGRGRTPVGTYDCPDCSYGLADMSGNVWELTRSPFQPYPYDPRDDRDDLSGDALWVMRGGSFSDEPANVRTAVRGGVDPGVRNPTIGFRLALTRF